MDKQEKVPQESPQLAGPEPLAEADLAEVAGGAQYSLSITNNSSPQSSLFIFQASPVDGGSSLAWHTTMPFQDKQDYTWTIDYRFVWPPGDFSK